MFKCVIGGTSFFNLAQEQKKQTKKTKQLMLMPGQSLVLLLFYVLSCLSILYEHVCDI